MITFKATRVGLTILVGNSDRGPLRKAALLINWWGNVTGVALMVFDSASGQTRASWAMVNKERGKPWRGSTLDDINTGVGG